MRMSNNRHILRFGLMCVVAVALSACERSDAGACTSARDAAVKVSILADDLNAAEASGQIDSYRLGELGAKIIAAGDRFGAKGNHQSYCTAVDKIRVEAELH